MKKLLVLLLVTVGMNFAYSQNYDLIVKSNGDSIACRIDSITDSIIYFEMKARNNWINTTINRNEVVEYKYNAIDKKMFVLIPGTSYIESPRQAPVGTLRDRPRNLVCMEYGLAFWVDIYYERLLPVSDNIGLTLRAGPSIGAGFVGGVSLHGGAGIMFGKNRHFGYIAAGLRHEFVEEEGRDTPYTLPYYEAFYRFVAYNGLVFQVGVESLILSAGIGYYF